MALAGISFGAGVGALLAQSSSSQLLAVSRKALNNNGRIEGSAQQLNGEEVSLNSSTIYWGDFLVPGTPTVVVNGSPRWSGQQNGTGSTSPTGYKVTVSPDAQLRYLVKRTNPITLSAVAVPPSPTGTRDITINTPSQVASIAPWNTVRNLTINSGGGNVTVPPGTYGAFNASNSNKTGFTFGISGSSTPAVYNLQSLTLNSDSRLNLLGPVIINVRNQVALNSNSAVFGSSTNQTWLQLNVSSAGVSVNSGAVIYGAIKAPAGRVTVDGTVFGTVQCDQLWVNSSGVIKLGMAPTPTPVPTATPTPRPTATPTPTPIPNRAPVAVNDSYMVDEDRTLTRNGANGVLANDTDPDNDVLGAVLISAPIHGDFTFLADGGFTYKPFANWNGTETFTYKATDGTLQSNIATVTITVNPVNDKPTANNASFETTEDTSVSGQLTASDPEDDVLTFQLVTEPQFGSLQLSSNGSFTYTPHNDNNGIDTFVFQVTDSHGATSNDATVEITILPVEEDPVAADDSFITDEETVLIARPGVLSNDRSPDGKALSAHKVSDPENGTLTLNRNGSFSYTPQPNFSGIDNFTYKNSTGSGTDIRYSNVATVTITVNNINDAPVAVNDEYSMDEDTVLTVSEKGVLFNDTDPDGDALLASVVLPPANGTLELNRNGTFVYTPRKDFSGTDTFIYLTSDGQESSQAQVKITVRPVNDAPRAEDSSVTTGEDVPVDIKLLASDPDNISLDYIIVSPPQHGALSGEGANRVYTPHANYSGSDSFTFKVSDGQLFSNVATVSITVTPQNDAPLARDDSYTTNEDEALNVSAADGLLANDTDPDGDALSVRLDSSTQLRGQLSLNTDGSFTYTPLRNFSGLETFAYIVSDGKGGEAKASATIIVIPFNENPVAVDDEINSEGTALDIPVLANDSDGDGDSLTVTSVTAGTQGGQTFINPDGTVRYVPPSGFGGMDTFHYTIEDGRGGTATAKVTVTMTKPAPINSRGTEYWLTFSDSYRSWGYPHELKFSISAEREAKGQVEIPGLNFTKEFSLMAGQNVDVVLPNNAQLGTNELVENLGIRVTADSPVSVYGVNYWQYESDSYLGLPVSSLGTDYLALGYQVSYWPSQIAVVATQDSTQITVTPKNAGISGKPAAVPFGVTLNKGQTYQFKSNGDLTGSSIQSNKPVTLLAGNSCTNVPTDTVACNQVMEQIPPVSSWGQEFVAMPLATRRRGDTFRILAARDSTQVTVNGSVVATLQRGQFYENRLADNNGNSLPWHITATQPVLVAQYSNGSSYDGVNADPFMMLVPSVNQYASRYTLTTPASGFRSNYLNLLVPSSATGKIQVDGTLLPASTFTPIGSSGYHGAQVPVSIGAHNIVSTDGTDFGISLYGFDDYDGYGHPGALGKSADAGLPPLPTPTPTATPSGPDTTVPTVTIDIPSNGEVVSSLNWVSGKARDNAGGSGVLGVVLSVQRRSDGLYWTGSNWGAATALSTNLVGENWWRVLGLSGANLQPGDYKIKATAFDRANNQASAEITVTVDNAPPTVNFTEPLDGATVYELPRVKGTADDEASGIAQVDLYLRDSSGRYWNGEVWVQELGNVVSSVLETSLSGEKPVKWQCSDALPKDRNLPPGAYTLTAVAYDGGGHSAGVTVKINVTARPGEPPTPTPTPTAEPTPTPTLEPTPEPSNYNDAVFVSQSVPTTMTGGQLYRVSVTMKNTGRSTWTSAGGYALGSENLTDNTTWGINRIGLDSTQVPTGYSVRFEWSVRAPRIAGTYNFQWRMVQENVERFGEYSPNVEVTVDAPPQPTPTPTPAATPTPTPTPTPSPGTGIGLRGWYFNGRNFETRVFTRIDPTVNFDWGNGSPGNGVNTDNYSVRWAGEVEAMEAGTYTFTTTSDDGIRLWVNGQLLIDKWFDQAPTSYTSAPVTLAAGQRYSIKIEYYENGGGAVARLLWTRPGQSLQVVPQSQLYPAPDEEPTPTLTPTPTPAVTPTPTLAPALPDAQIIAAGGAEYLGNDIYNSTGENQTATLTVPSNAPAAYGIAIENDGQTASVMKVVGPASSSGWTIKYFDALNGGADITPQVTGGGWLTPVIPGNNVFNNFYQLRIEVTPGTAVLGGARREVSLRVTLPTGLPIDVVKAVTTKTVSINPTPTPGPTPSGTPTPQPGSGPEIDAQIAAEGDGAPVGATILNTTGENQTRSLTVPANKAARYVVYAVNNGPGGTKVKLTAPAGDENWQVKYLNYDIDTGATTDITSEVTGGTWTSPVLTEFTYAVVLAEVTPLTAVPVGESRELLIKAESDIDPSRVDVVKAVTTRGPGGEPTPTPVPTATPQPTPTRVPTPTPVPTPEGPRPSAPTVQITSPASGSELTQPQQIWGRITDVSTQSGPSLDFWRLEYQLVGENTGWVEFGRGTSSVPAGAALAKLDPTLMLNGLYEIRLTAFDRWRQSASDSINVVINGGMKIGHFTVSFADMTLPVAGMPISVTRTYDSREATSGRMGDFGYGWTLDLANIRVQKNGPVGGTENEPAWKWVKLGGFFQSYAIAPIKPRIVTITMPDGRVFHFQADFSPNSQAVGKLAGSNIVWRGVRGTKGSLRGVDNDGFAWFEDNPYSTNGVTLRTEGGEDDWGDPVGGGDIYDAREFELTLPDGTVFRLKQGASSSGGGIQWIRDLNGNVLRFNRNAAGRVMGITSTPAGATTPARSVAITRNGDGRITKITDPRGNSVLYNIVNGDLVSSTDRENNTTAYQYNEPRFAHYLTGIQDPRGPGFVPLRNFYDEEGRLDYSLDGFGKKIDYVHDLANKLETVVDRMGNESRLAYDSYGNVTQSSRVLRIDSDGDGQYDSQRLITTKSEYSDSNNPDKPTKVVDAYNRATTFVYDGDGNLLRVKEPFTPEKVMTYTLGRLDKEFDANGKLVLDNDYDAKGRLTQSKVPWKEANGTQLYATSRYEFDSTNNSPVPNRVFDAKNNETRYGYDTQTGNVTRVVRVNKEGTNQDSIVDFTYDPNGNKTKQIVWRTVQNSDGSSAKIALQSSYEYDKQDRVFKTIAPDNTVSRTEYNAIGKVERSIRSEGASYGGVSLTRITQHVYDELGQRTKTIYPDSTSTQVKYNDNGQVERSWDRAGRSSETLYDSLGRSVSNRLYDADGNLLKNAAGQPLSTLTEYDDLDRVIRTRDEKGHWSETVYDDANRATTRKDTVTTKDGLVTLRQTTVSDENGRTAYTLDSASRRTDFVYDTAGRLLQTLYPTLTDSNGNALPRTSSSTQYDELGRAVKETNASGLWKSYDYDSMGRLAQVIQPVDEDPAKNIVTKFGYDETGNKVSQTDGNNHTTTFGYDKLGRSVWRKMPNGQSESMEYDALGQLRRKKDFRGFVTEYSYDVRGRLIAKTPDARLNEAALTYTYPSEFVSTATRGSGATALTTTSYFDRERGRLIKTETPTGTLEYSYDDAGNKTKVKSTAGGGTNETTYGYDELGRLTTVRDSGDLLATYNYDALGNRESINRANGVSTTYRYDEQNRLRNMTHRKGTAVLSSFTYNVRNDGKRTGVTESLLNADEVNGVQRTTDRAVAYTFDLSGRLTSESGTDGREIAYENAWQYDAAGNRTGTTAKRASAVGATTWTSVANTVATFNNNDWLTSQTTATQSFDASGALTNTTSSTTAWTYDDNGSELTQQVNDNNPIVNTWSHEDKMLSRETQGGSKYEYSYDATGNRIGVRTTKNGETTTQNYLVDPNTSYAQVLQERDENGVLQGRWVWDDANLAPLVMYRRAQNGSYALFFYLTDGQENIRQLTDASGSVTDSYYYDAWGNALGGGSGNTPNPFRYTGQQLDASGLYYLRARYMNTGTGRFLSHDPLWGNEEDPITLHRYLYAGNDPVDFVDPSGESFICDVLTTVFSKGNLQAMAMAGVTNALISSGIAYISGETYGWQDALADFAKGAVFQGGLAAFGKAVALVSKALVSRNFIGLYWMGSAEQVFWKKAYGVFFGGAGAQNAQWATFMNKITNIRKALVGGETVVGGPNKVLEAIYTLDPFERQLFQLAIGNEFSYFFPHWWKGLLGQYFAREAGKTYLKYPWYTPPGAGAGNVVTGRILLMIPDAFSDWKGRISTFIHSQARSFIGEPDEDEEQIP